MVRRASRCRWPVRRVVTTPATRTTPRLRNPPVPSCDRRRLVPHSSGGRRWAGPIRVRRRGVSRHFKYKSAEALAQDARSRGLDIRLSDDLAPLAAPIEVGGRRVGNRLAIQPMEGCDGTLDGAPDELTFRRYRRFGEGGAKLIWGEAAAVVPEGRANPRQLLIDESHAAGLARARRDLPERSLARLGPGRRPARRPPADPLGPLQRPPADPRPARPAARPPDGRRPGHRGRPPTGTPPPLRRRARPAPGPLRRRRVAGAAGSASTSWTSSSATATCSTSCSRPGRARQVRRLVREPDPVHPRGRRAHPLREPRGADRHPAQRLRRHPVPPRRRRTGRGSPAPSSRLCNRPGARARTTRSRPTWPSRSR